MRLPGRTINLLREDIQRCFDETSLRDFLSTTWQAEKPLNKITMSGPFDQQVLGVIQFAESRSLTGGLLDALVTERPNDSDLRAFRDTYKAIADLEQALASHANEREPKALACYETAKAESAPAAGIFKPAEPAALDLAWELVGHPHLPESLGRLTHFVRLLRRDVWPDRERDCSDWARGLPTVLVSHDPGDRKEATELAYQLTGRRLIVTQKEWNPAGGDAWREEARALLAESRAVVLCVGGGGLGPWALPETSAALEEQLRVQTPVRVIPCRLSAAPRDFAPPPFVRQNTVVEVGDASYLKRLCWAITDERPPGLAPEAPPAAPGGPRPAAGATDVEAALDNLADALAAGSKITFVLGMGLSPGNGQNSPPSPSQIARDLLAFLGFIRQDYDELLPPLDTAGAYFAVSKDRQYLERRVADLIRRRSGEVQAAQQQLARLLRQLPARRPASRKPSEDPLLVISTCLDVLTERALLQAGLSFTRVVQIGAEAQVQVNHFRQAPPASDRSLRLEPRGEDPIEVPRDDVQELDKVIRDCECAVIRYSVGTTSAGRAQELTLKEKDMLGLVLYKFCGSYDVPHSCTISAQQYFDFTRRLLQDNSLCQQICKLSQDKPALFLGCGFLDTPFRLAYHTLLRRSPGSAPENWYAPQPTPVDRDRDPYRRMEQPIWDNIKTKRLLSKARAMHRIAVWRV